MSSIEDDREPQIATPHGYVQARREYGVRWPATGGVSPMENEREARGVAKYHGGTVTKRWVTEWVEEL